MKPLPTLQTADPVNYFVLHFFFHNRQAKPCLKAEILIFNSCNFYPMQLILKWFNLDQNPL